MSTDQNPVREPVGYDSPFLHVSERSTFEQLLGFLFGFDFFVSYS